MSSVDSVLSLVRPDILALAAYSSARKEAKGGRIWLDANENPETPSAHAQLLNRYPEPQPVDLVAKLATLYGVTPAQTLVSRGSDEGIDLLLRTFCRAGQDAILITPPTYGMYTVAAGIQGARVVKVPLIASADFALDADTVIATALANPAIKLVFLCSPNNPTGNLLVRSDVLKITRALLGHAVVVADEAYIDFSDQPSLATELPTNPNLVILRTLSKAFGLAGARVGTTIAHPEIIAVLQKVIAPYPIPAPVVQAAVAALSDQGLADARASVALLISERRRLVAELPKLRTVKKVWPSDTNYLLLEVTDANAAMAAGRAAGVIWRDRQKDVPSTIRITVGSPEENNATLEVLARV
jgi:histidinol-phosphate aminotransferase